MSISRRNFMKLVGVSVSSLLLTRCRFIFQPMCYTPVPPSPTTPSSAREALRSCWFRFDELATAAIQESKDGDYDNTFGQQLLAEHRTALDALVTEGAITVEVADLVHEAYAAAVFHVWRSNIPVTCYEPVMVNYAPASAGILVKQAEVFEQIADAGGIDPETLERARTALEHDMAFYALSDEEVGDLYERLIAEWQSQQQAPPAFEDIELEITPDAQAAARFIIELLTAP